MILSRAKKETFHRLLAAVDLGSNSFHMIVARASDQTLQVQDRLREMVRLGAGLDDEGHLAADARLRALECLERFGQRLRGMADREVRVVGTNTLRAARDQGDFLRQAEAALGHSVEIISGIEEARLIYLGVAHSLAEDGMRRMVIDIGGGSTEVIIGERFEPLLLESLDMGCVSMSRQFFPDGAITPARLKAAELAAQLELEGFAHRCHQMGWEQTVGASGTAKALARVVQAQGWSEQGISAKSLKQLRKAILDVGHIDELKLKGLSEERRPVFIGGFTIMAALFASLDIKQMLVSDGALREGLLYDMLGRHRHEDVRERSVELLQKRYQIDTEHARHVEQTALSLLQQAAESWQLDDPVSEQMLGWAARLHEIGLAIAHSGYHKHGAYLLENSDLSGFSLQQQQVLAILVRSHRRKPDPALFSAFPRSVREAMLQLTILLRLAVKLQRSRLHAALPDIRLKARPRQLKLSFPDEWLDQHDLTRADLEREVEYLRLLDYELKITTP
ncbi:exopolyphosphatase [Thiohalophilus sp.]|uniref:exopolyphosphatase n=1 Tax=Thiohalophilus sp. TaxID=3028392 RepID=UPI002ACECAD2|nr:exopolyphosphatase [Thiohalophilus sp.]MDZ7661534.1 exopolyphosphatase [Thiohalophilus sp.]